MHVSKYWMWRGISSSHDSRLDHQLIFLSLSTSMSLYSTHWKKKEYPYQCSSRSSSLTGHWPWMHFSRWKFVWFQSASFIRIRNALRTSRSNPKHVANCCSFGGSTIRFSLVEGDGWTESIGIFIPSISSEISLDVHISGIRALLAR